MKSLLPLALLALPAWAGDLEDESSLKESQDRFSEAVKSMNSKCGTQITASYAIDTEKLERERFDSANKKWKYEPNPTSGQFRLKKGFGYDFCACALKAIEEGCEKDTFKEFIAAKVKSIPCEFKHLNKFETELIAASEKSGKAPAGYMNWEVAAQKDSIRHEYKDGVLKTFVDADMSNCGTYTTNYVHRNLGLDDQEATLAAKGRFEEELKAMNETCGTNITATYDLKSEKLERERYDSANKKWNIEPNPAGGQWRLRPGYGYDFCACAFQGAKSNCEKDAFKAMFAKKVKSMQCQYKPLHRLEQEMDEAYNKNHKLPPGYADWEVDAQRDDIRHELKGGVLKTFIDADTSNCGNFTSKWLLRKL
jgi:hypothetical protein